MTATIIEFPIQQWSAIETVKAMPHDFNVAHQPQSYEESMMMKIELAKWRVQSYKDSNDDESANDEYMYQCGLENSLKEFRAWSL